MGFDSKFYQTVSIFVRKNEDTMKKFKVTLSYTAPTYTDVLVSAKDAKEARSKIKKFIKRQKTGVVREACTNVTLEGVDDLTFCSDVIPFHEKIEKIEEVKK